MKYHYKFLALLFITLTVTSALYSQQKMQPTRLLVMEDVVYPNKSFEYEKAQKAMNDFIKASKIGLTWDCYQTDDYTYMYVIPFTTLSALDSLYDVWDKKFGALNQEDMNNHIKSFVGTIEGNNTIVVKLHPEASYHSPNPYVKPEEVKFIHWDFFEIIPGKEKEAWELSKQYNDINKKSGAGQDYDAWSVDFGPNSSTIIFTTPSSSDADFYSQMHQDEKKAGNQFDELYPKFMDCVHKFTHFNGKPRPDLSITAAKM